MHTCVAAEAAHNESPGASPRHRRHHHHHHHHALHPKSETPTQLSPGPSHGRALVSLGEEEEEEEEVMVMEEEEEQEVVKEEEEVEAEAAPLWPAGVRYKRYEYL